MKTYRILSCAADLLLRLLHGLALAEEERALLRACVVRHVEVCGDTWEIVVGTQTVMDDALIEPIAAQVAAKY